MSRSRRKTPKVALVHTHSESEKDDKVRAHRKERHAVKTKLIETLDTDAVAIERKRAAGNFAKDGKQWLKQPTSKDMRK